jgi:hypothetical protein
MEMVEGHRGTATAGIGRGMETGLARPGMEMAEHDRRVMELGLGHPEMAGIQAMGEGLAPLVTSAAGLDRLGILEVAGPQHLLLGRHQRLGRLLRLQLGLLRVVLLRADLIRGIRRVVRSRRNGPSHRLVRVREDLVGITMERRRGRPVIVAKPVLAAVGVREVNRNEIVQA